MHTLTAPRRARPEPNVIVRICDIDGNEAVPMAHPDNVLARRQIESWSRVASNLFLWDYLIKEYPQPSEFSLPGDIAYFQAHHVTGYFWENEEPAGDFTDLNRWLQLKYFEDPERADGEELRQRYMRRAYGRAADDMETYRTLIRGAAVRNHAKAWSFGDEFGLHHVDLDTLVACQALFDAALAKAESEDVRRRVARARMVLDAIDGYVLARYYRNIWEQSGREGAYPLDPAAARARMRETLADETRHGHSMLEDRMRKRLDRYEALPESVPEPAPFRGKPYFDLTPEFFGWDGIAQVTPDPDADIGYARILEFPADSQAARFPLPFAVDDTLRGRLLARAVRREEIPAGGGYHWLRLGRFAPGPRAALIWEHGPGPYIGVSDLAGFAGGEEKEVDLWLRLRLDGDWTKAGDAKTARLERVVAVRAKDAP